MKTEQYEQKYKHTISKEMAQKFRLVTQVTKHIEIDVKQSNQLIKSKDSNYLKFYLRV